MKVARTVPRGGKPERAYLSQLGQQVNIRCKQYCLDKTIIKLMKKYLILDPKPSDLTMVRVVRREVVHINVVRFHREYI